MNIISQIEYQQLKQFEDLIGGNVKVGGYDMDIPCPIVEGYCYQIKLQEDDINRLFLLGEGTFSHLTLDQSYLISDLTDAILDLKRVKYWLNKQLDLRLSSEWSPIFVCPETDSGPIVKIDGNHRLMAHFHQHNTIEGLHGYLFVHPNIQKWGFMPYGAK